MTTETRTYFRYLCTVKFTYYPESGGYKCSEPGERTGIYVLASEATEREQMMTEHIAKVEADNERLRDDKIELQIKNATLAQK